MQTPDFDVDGWCLEDGEQRHREAPATFHIPSRRVREHLKPGDFAKLIFRIAVDNTSEPERVERMWVIVRECHPDGYVGTLDNEPSAIQQNDTFWLGTELPFEPRHIIAVMHAKAGLWERLKRSLLNFRRGPE